MFTNNSALVVMFMPFSASMSRSTKGKITKKHIYLPLAVGGLIGGTGTLAGSTAPLLANEVLEITGQKQFSFFTTAPVALSVLFVTAICYYLFLYDLSVKWFDFEEVETTGKISEGPDFNLRNAVISLCVFAVSVVCFILRPFGWDLGLVAVTGAAIVVLLKCVDGRKELQHMMWSALLTLGSALAVADGFVQSGAGDVVISWLMRIFGHVVTDGKFMVALFILSGWLLSMFMSNGSLVSMLASVGIPLAVANGVNPTPIAISCVMGANLAMATPVATTTITIKGDTVIGNDVWIGQNAVILPGVHIGDGAIIGANSVVGSDIDPYTIVIGNPARVLRKRFDDELIDLMLRFKWWDRSIEEIDALIPILTSSDLDIVRKELQKRL